MAVVPPPPAPVVPAPPAKRSGFAGCGFGCLGCLGVFVVLALLLVGSGWYFFVVQAQAAISAPAALVVFNAPVEVGRNDSGYRTAVPGQHLIAGANFKVGGHSVSAEVRGTEFEVLVRADHTNKIWVFVGAATVTGKTAATLTAGQEIDADADGNLSNQRSNQFETQDPFPLAAQCGGTASSGNNAGTAQTSISDSIATGQSEEHVYDSIGGNLTVALCYPGSLMSVTVTEPLGGPPEAQGKSPLTIKIPNAPPGRYRAMVRGVDVRGGESHSVSFATDAACGEGNVDPGGGGPQAPSDAPNAERLSHTGGPGGAP